MSKQIKTEHGDVVIGTPREKLWNDVKLSAENILKRANEDIEIQTQVLDLANSILEQEEQEDQNSE